MVAASLAPTPGLTMIEQIGCHDFDLPANVSKICGSSDPVGIAPPHPSDRPGEAAHGEHQLFRCAGLRTSHPAATNAAVRPRPNWNEQPPRESLTGVQMASLNDKHQRALGILARSPNGCAEADMLAYGFKCALLADLVQNGLVTANPQDTREGRHSVTVAWITITDAGRKAIAD
jgi:hypothetical protein